MMFEASDFVFRPPKEVAFARRVLIKPVAAYPLPHPVTTSRETLGAVIEGIRKVSPADIVLLDKSAGNEPVLSIYKSLRYDFPHTILLDVDQCIPVAVENPLPKPFATSTFWVPNVILSCDFLISIAPFRTVAGDGDFTIRNLLGLLPTEKYPPDLNELLRTGDQLTIDHLIADLYFTLPFDLGIVDGRRQLISDSDPAHGKIEDRGEVFVGTPFEVDREASEAAGVRADYLGLIEQARAEQGDS
jgi:uncharacterized protein (DUF362 family)